MNKLQAYILAGGKSSRMKSDKGLLSLHGKPFTAHILEAVQSITKDVTIVTSNQAYAQFNCSLIEDEIPEMGPAGGIFTALKHSGSEWNLILSCDIPFIKSSLLNHLIQTNGNESAVIGETNLKLHPLPGLYRKSLQAEFEMAVKNDKLRLMDIIKSVECKTVLIPSEMNDQLRNINTLKDYNLYETQH